MHAPPLPQMVILPLLLLLNLRRHAIRRTRACYGGADVLGPLLFTPDPAWHMEAWPVAARAAVSHSGDVLALVLGEPLKNIAPTGLATKTGWGMLSVEVNWRGVL
jgi:hypothetical protein